jgi:hypothetical protein
MQLSRVQFTARRIAATVAVAAPVLLALSLWLFVVRPHQQHLEWYRGVEDRIVRLADKRPEGVSPSRWAYCLHWTRQLHSNYGTYEFIKPREQVRFLREFDRRLRAKVDVDTIDWIWDEYAKQTAGGLRYSQHYRPTDPGNIRFWFTDQKESYNLQEWLDRLNRLKTK